MKKKLKKSAALLMAASIAAVSLMGCSSGAKSTETTAAARGRRVQRPESRQPGENL